VTEELATTSGDRTASTSSADLDSAVDAVRPPRVPRRVWTWSAVAVVVLGVGGAFLEHTLDTHGIPAFSVSTASTTPLSASSARPSTTRRPAGGATAGSLAGFMGTVHLRGAVAPDFHLTDQTGTTFDLASLRGKVVVLTFLGAGCETVCPVLSKELLLSNALLGRDAANVALVAVNTDPLDTSRSAVARTSAATGLARIPSWRFLTGTLAALDPVWTHYGVTVDVSTVTHRVAHTDVIYLLDTQGRERIRVTPFADESRTGRVSLPEASIRRFATGLASYTRSLLAPARP
jgi:cytochrome oxidase Cu insertion factor (SCO1/SenC/PrrC family)